MQPYSKEEYLNKKLIQEVTSPTYGEFSQRVHGLHHLNQWQGHSRNYVEVGTGLVFQAFREMGHDNVLFFVDQETGLEAIIALHDTSPGITMGATRMWQYPNELMALHDALRLSRGMTYKAACANIPVGGAKAVIIGHPNIKTKKLLRAYGRGIKKLNGLFVTGQDVNLNVEDIRTVREVTRHVTGLHEHDGGPTQMTAEGVVLAMQAALTFKWRSKSFAGLTVAVQGVGNVGRELCKHLHNYGAKLAVSDINPDRTAEMRRLYDATVVDMNEIYSFESDIFAPCALGAILNDETIPLIKAPIVAGSANNQLAVEQKHSHMLAEKQILYCPDYVVNAGGLINVYHEMIGYHQEKARSHLQEIHKTLLTILTLAHTNQITTLEAANHLAEDRMAGRRAQRSVSSTNKIENKMRFGVIEQISDLFRQPATI